MSVQACIVTPLHVLPMEIFLYPFKLGNRGNNGVKVLCYKSEIPAGVSGFFIDIILPITLWPWGRHSL